MKLYEARGVALHLCNRHGRRSEETNKANKKRGGKRTKNMEIINNDIWIDPNIKPLMYEKIKKSKQISLNEN